MTEDVVASIAIGLLVGMFATGGLRVFICLDILAVGVIIDVLPRRFIPTWLIRWYHRELMER